ncbi:MAG TPA: sensor histidine kinase [Bryobacteraceae bacterium]|jgi:signal transduction histidine kinase|nr:sensor histidine kinase [Bryobacteraceae bacterium]
MPLVRDQSNLAAADSDSLSPRLRWVLLGTFVALLALIFVSGAAATRTLREMHEQEQEARRAVASRAQTLSKLYVSIEVYNEDIGRYLGYPLERPDPLMRQQVDRLTSEIESQLDGYPDGRQPEEAALLKSIAELYRRHLALYRSAENAATSPGARGEILTLRTQLIDGSGEVNAWNGRQIQTNDETLLAQFSRLQASLTGSLSIALAGGLLLVVASMAYILRLERQTRSRYDELAQSRYELERLSSRLVDAQEEERRSISRELHDEVGQSLGALLVDLGRLSTNLPADTSEIHERIDHMKSLTERTVGTVRDIALLLRPSMLDDLGLVAALEWQGREVSRRSEMEVAVESANVSDELPDEYKICVYRLVQEALNNAVRHSRARNAKVRVAGSASAIEIEVRDDGRGFDPKRARGLGILGMEERVKRLGGSLAVDSAPGQGTVVKAELPLPVAAGTPA